MTAHELTTAEETKKKSPMFTKSGWSFFLEVAKVVVISLAIILPVKQFLFQPFYVKGASMEPNFYDNEYLIVNEIGYRFHEPARGDVVVLRYPQDPSQYFIKRVIGLPGETVAIRRGTVTITNTDHPGGFVLDEEQYLPEGLMTQGSQTTTLDDTEYFVLGDNRPASLDSRSPSLGPVPRSAIVGRAWFRLWPFSRVAAFGTPSYSAPASSL